MLAFQLWDELVAEFDFFLNNISDELRWLNSRAPNFMNLFSDLKDVIGLKASWDWPYKWGQKLGLFWKLMHNPGPKLVCSMVRFIGILFWRVGRDSLLKLRNDQWFFPYEFNLDFWCAPWRKRCFYAILTAKEALLWRVSSGTLVNVGRRKPAPNLVSSQPRSPHHYRASLHENFRPRQSRRRTSCDLNRPRAAFVFS